MTGDFPEVLILEAGDRVDGTFKRLERANTRDGEPRVIAVIELDGAERSLWLHETALRSKMRELKPEPDERVFIAKGKEKKKSASGYNYWPFAVSAPDRPKETVDWDDAALADDGDAGEVDVDLPVDLPEVPKAKEADDDESIPF